MRPLMMLLAGLAFGQQASRPAFEVASIKPAAPGSAFAIRRSGNHIAATNASLQFLITWAYDIYPERLLGRTAWLDSVRYDVVANAPEGPMPARPAGEPGPLQLMMQNLLAERFKLAVHTETRELPVYALVVTRNGAKVQPEPISGAMTQTPFRMPARGHLVGSRVSAAMLAKALSDQLGRTVQDETGLDGIFDFELRWTPDQPPAPGAAPELGAGPSLFTALQEQLGLKLEGRKGKVEVLVIDSVERAPTEN